MQHFFSVGTAAEDLSQQCGEYVPTHRVAAAVRRLIADGRIPCRRVGRAHLILDAEIQLVAEALRLTCRAEGGAA